MLYLNHRKHEKGEKMRKESVFEVRIKTEKPSAASAKIAAALFLTEKRG